MYTLIFGYRFYLLLSNVLNYVFIYTNLETEGCKNLQMLIEPTFVKKSVFIFMTGHTIVNHIFILGYDMFNLAQSVRII